MIDTGFKPEESSEYPGYFKVPRFDGLFINRSGEVLSSSAGKLESLFYGEYMAVNVPGRKTQHIHRLLAMTFIECPGAFEDFIVNHLDGDKLNNSIDNLEWTSYAGNIKHAYINGLRNDNLRLLVKDVEEGKVESFYSLAECARWLAVNNSVVHMLLNVRIPRLFRDRYLIIVEGCAFPDFYIPHKPKKGPQPENFKRKPVPIVVTNLRDGSVQNWDSVELFALDKGSSKSTVQKSVWKKAGIWREYKIEYVSV